MYVNIEKKELKREPDQEWEEVTNDVYEKVFLAKVGVLRCGVQLDVSARTLWHSMGWLRWLALPLCCSDSTKPHQAGKAGKRQNKQHSLSAVCHALGWRLF